MGEAGRQRAVRAADAGRRQRMTRIAIAGTGNIARIHAESLRALADPVELVAAADIEPERVREFCAAHGVPRAYPDLSSMLAEARPDLVHLCTPPGGHHAQALECLRAGASVLVEKPPTRGLRELEELAAAQGASGPWLATVFQHRFGSGAARLTGAMRDGALGRPLLAICHTTWFRDQSYFDVPWRGRWDTEGGGPTMGHGIHQLDLLTAVLGDWVEVSAHARRQARRTQTEDLSLAHVSFANGAVASVVNSVVSPREESYLRFDFERATVELTHLYGYGDDDWRVTPVPGFEQSVAEAWEAGPSGRASGHGAQFAEVVRCLRAGVAPPVGTDGALRTMRLVAGVYASAFEGRSVRCAELGPDSPFYERMDGSGARWAW
ncbi:Gfo/Idh/MocA family oxidoreductase [Rugosimonospora acidiphila]|uniref:Gfo/Idh/MocA family oxidoreductase n=1 Tax=Rugosimonospora acidiphila TaxID=556531 RepID=A0ABP9RMQ1_9ACTN